MSSSCAVSFCNKSNSFSFAGAVSALNAVMGHPSALQMEYVMAHDTAVSALGKILQFHRENLKAEKVYLLFLVSRLTSKEAFVFHQMYDVRLESMLGSKTVAGAKLGINLPFRKHIMAIL